MISAWQFHKSGFIVKSINHPNSVRVSQFCEQIYKTVSRGCWFWLKWFAQQSFCDEYLLWLIFSVLSCYKRRHRPIKSRHKSCWCHHPVLYDTTGHKVKKTIWQRQLGMSALHCSLRRQTAVDVRFTDAELKLLHPSALFKSTRLLHWKQ